MLVSAVQQSESAICIYISPYPLPLEPPSHPPYPTRHLLLKQIIFTLLTFKVIIDREGFASAILLFPVSLVVLLSFNRCKVSVKQEEYVLEICCAMLHL